MPESNRATPNDASPEAALRALRDGLAAVEGFDAAAIELDLWDARIALAACRRDLAPDTPLLSVLLGPTGAGKSTLLSALAGREIAATSALRPCTTRPPAIGAPDAIPQPASDAFLREHALDVEWRGDAGLPPCFTAHVVVDTPDFDSVLTENRRRALPLFERADRVIVVLTPEKYGDAIVWRTIDALRPLGNFAAAIFNKAEGTIALDDATALLAERGFMPPLAVPRIGSEASLAELIAAAPALPDVLACHDGAALRVRLRQHAAAGNVGCAKRASHRSSLRSSAQRPAWHSARPSFDAGCTRTRALALRLDDACAAGTTARRGTAALRRDAWRAGILALPLRAARLVVRRRRAGSGPSLDTVEWLASMHDDRFHRLHLDLVARYAISRRKRAARRRPGHGP